MTLDELKAYRATLAQERTQNAAQREQLTRNDFALQGALQACDQLIAKEQAGLAPAESVETPPAAPTLVKRAKKEA